jgi:Co/Zn/Cd efflux system component
MDDCCRVITISEQQRRIFHVVMGINVGMFLLESVAGIPSYSTALLADSLPIGRLCHKA